MNEYISLYDYLNKSASSIHKDLGFEIYQLSRKKNIKPRFKNIPWNNKNEDGSKRILMYPVDFLNQAFNTNKIKNLING